MLYSPPHPKSLVQKNTSSPLSLLISIYSESTEQTSSSRRTTRTTTAATRGQTLARTQGVVGGPVHLGEEKEIRQK